MASLRSARSVLETSTGRFIAFGEPDLTPTLYRALLSFLLTDHG
jgi:hypothetical protein